MELIAVRSPEMTIRRALYGVEGIGSGAVIAEQMRRDAYLNISWNERNSERGDIGRRFYTASVAKEMLDKVGMPTVGGLFQLAVLSPRGAESVPHFYWVPVGSTRGTYVAMRMESGEWVQDHRPTDTKVKVREPFDIQLRGPRWRQWEAFDLAATLTKDSPGVIEAPSPFVLQFCPYDPDRVHSLIRRSWGDTPLPPLTWAEGPPKRHRP